MWCSMATTFEEVKSIFRSMPQTRFDIPEALEDQWLKTAVADYELNIGRELPYDDVTKEFAEKIPAIVQTTLGRMMYVSYLTRELSRVMALNGIYGKDVQLTGQDATKRVTKQELDSQIALVELLLHRQKTPAYG